MKLNRKFSIVVVITIAQIAVLTLFTLFYSKRLMNMKHYQYMQVYTQSQIGDVLTYMTRMNYQGFFARSALSDWDDICRPLEDNFDYLLHDSIIKRFPDDFRQDLESIQTLWETLNIRFDALRPVLEQMQETEQPLGAYTDVQTSGIRQTAQENPEEESTQRLLSLLETAQPEIDGIRRSSDSISRLNKRSAVKMVSILEEKERIFIILIITIAIVSSVVLATLISIVTAQVSSRIKRVCRITSVLAEKDFTVSIKPVGSTEMQLLMNNINDMVNQINDFFIVVKTTATRAISSGYSINDSAYSTSEASAEIDKSIELITEQFSLISGAVETAVELISDMNKKVSVLVENNSRQTASIDESDSALRQVVETLNYINNMAAERTKTTEAMQALVADSDQKISLTNNLLEQVSGQLVKITDIVTIINKVARQTDLLSMNAAIESAHAGEAGKGFGVVAGEIRKLAEDTSKNAVKISQAVSEIVEAVNRANTASSTVAEAFGRVRTNSDSVVTSFKEISGGIERIDSQLIQIKERTADISMSATQINGFCGELAASQTEVSDEVGLINERFTQALEQIRKIKEGTGGIVQRMKSVTAASKESYKNMTDLENVLEKFHTKSEVDEAVEQADSENSIQTAVSQNLMNMDDMLVQFAEGSPVSASGSDDIDFDPDAVETFALE